MAGGAGEEAAVAALGAVTAPDVQEEPLCLLGLSHAACGQGADVGPC